MRAENVAIYVWKSITSKKHDAYEAKLEQFCRQFGWRNPKIYHNRAGGTVEAKELEDIARTLGAALSDCPHCQHPLQFIPFFAAARERMKEEL